MKAQKTRSDRIITSIKNLDVQSGKEGLFSIGLSIRKERDFTQKEADEIWESFSAKMRIMAIPATDHHANALYKHLHKTGDWGRPGHSTGRPVTQQSGQYAQSA